MRALCVCHSGNEPACAAPLMRVPQLAQIQEARIQLLSRELEDLKMKQARAHEHGYVHACVCVCVCVCARERARIGGSCTFRM